MRHYGLLGEKLSHSYSKEIHTYLFKRLNLDADYSLIECQQTELKEYIQKLRDGFYHGFNVTIPYKKTILSYLDEIDDKAKRIGSVNTIYLKDGKVCGTNTDYDGFLETLKQYQVEVQNKHCYVLGTGGASLSVCTVLQDLGGIVCQVSRTPNLEQISYKELEDKSIDLLVNTTPVGMYPNIDASPVTKEIACKAKKVIDIIFNPTETVLLRNAHSEINGLYMLVMQAMKAEEIWQQKSISVSGLEIMDYLKLLLNLPKEIYELIKGLRCEKDSLGQSQDEVYVFDQLYVLKISSSKEGLLREKECNDWLESKIPGPKSILFLEHNSRFYYLRSYLKGDSLISKRFLEQPLLLIETIKKVVTVLRSLDSASCPFQSRDSKGNSFIHGDLCLPNIYVNEANEFVGFIDLEDAGLGDVWMDYAWLIWSFEHNLKTKEYTKQLLDALGLKMDYDKYNQYVQGGNKI